MKLAAAAYDPAMTVSKDLCDGPKSVDTQSGIARHLALIHRRDTQAKIGKLFVGSSLLIFALSANVFDSMPDTSSIDQS